jgi:hypothetical protein
MANQTLLPEIPLTTRTAHGLYVLDNRGNCVTILRDVGIND